MIIILQIANVNDTKKKKTTFILKYKFYNINKLRYENEYKKNLKTKIKLIK